MLAVAGGAVAGSLLRFAADAAAAVAPQLQVWPLSTFVVNMLGCLLIGLFLGYVTTRQVSTETQALVTTGFLGGLTTFSAFAAEVVQMAERGAWIAAVLYPALSVVLGITAVRVGRSLGVRWATP